MIFRVPLNYFEEETFPVHRDGDRNDNKIGKSISTMRRNSLMSLPPAAISSIARTESNEKLKEMHREVPVRLGEGH